MYEKELLIDGKGFAKTNRISAKRPTEYWLLFLKRYVLSYKKPWFKKQFLIFTIPLALLVILLLSGADGDTIFPVLFVSAFICFFIFIFLMMTVRMAFVPINEFHDLAKFIIAIKGDIYKNRFSLMLNSDMIEKDTNLLDPNKIGLAKRRKTVYKPFELERFKANFILKDGSVCNVSLHQITLRVTTTKRRSSGKTKTKTKRKHKLFYALTLKLKDEDYNVFNPGPAIMENDRFSVALHTENGFHYAKVKTKVKSLHINSKLDKSTKHQPSIYTEMMEYLLEHNIVWHTTTKKLTP